MELLHLGLFAWCLPLIAIPVLLHLLTLHRLRTVDLSTFRFLFDTYVQQRRKMKFMDALIAALRTLFLLFLIMACARPMIRHWSTLFGGTGGGRDVYLLVDASASMNAVTDGVSAFDRAKTAASTVIDKLSSGDRVSLLRITAKPEEIVSRVTADTEMLKERLGGLKTSPSRANLFATFTQLFGGDSPIAGKPWIYLFTDSQSSGWRELKEQPADGLLPSGAKLFVIDVGTKAGEIPNRAVIGEPPEAHRAIAGLPLPLKTRVVNYSKSEPQDVTVSLLIDDKEISRKNLSLKPGESVNAPFLFVPNEPGSIRCRFEIAGDRFPDDDSFLFTLTVEPQVRVVIINGNPNKNPNDPFENEALYLQTAFTATEPEESDALKSNSAATTNTLPAAAKTNSLTTEADRRFVRSLDVVELPEAQINADSLKDASVVILANCGNLNDQQCGMLRDHVSRGGGLMILPGDKINHDQINKRLLAVPGTTDQFISAAQLQPPVGELDKSETFDRFASIDFAHPVLSVFENRDARYLTKVSVYRRFPLKLPADRGNSWPLIEFSNGDAAVVESRYGDGRIILAAFPMSSKWTNLPLKPEFVPLVLRLVSHIRQRAGVEGPSVVAANGTAEISVAKTWQNLQAEVENTSGIRLPVTFEKSVSRQVGAFSMTAEKGFYDVSVRGGRTEQPKHETLSFAVNLAREESNLALITEPQLKELLPNVDLTVVDASAETQQLHGSIGQEHEIWRPLIYLLFVIIAVEFWLSTFSGQHLDEDTPTVTERIKDVATGGWVGRMTGAGEGT